MGLVRYVVDAVVAERCPERGQWRARQDSNLRPSAPEADALSTELQARERRWYSTSANPATVGAGWWGYPPARAGAHVTRSHA